MTSCWANYHVFLALLDGRSYRCSATLDDAAFDRLMDALGWKMPYQLRAFHTSDPSQAAKNPVLKAAPELPVDIDGLLSALPLQPTRLKDKRRRQTLTVRRKCGAGTMCWRIRRTAMAGFTVWTALPPVW